MQFSKKNNNRKRKERPLTSYFTPAATAPVVARVPAAVGKQQDKSGGNGEKGSSNVDVESTTPINTVVQQQSTKQAQASSCKKTAASKPKSKKEVEVESNLSASDDDDDIALSDLKQPKTKRPLPRKGECMQ